MAENWLLDEFRITAFFSQSGEKDNDSWFEIVTGVAPETTQIRRAEGIKIDTGMVGGFRYTLVVTDARADWKVSIEPGEDKGLDEGIGPVDSLSDRLQAFKPWLDALLHVNRLALGVTAKIPSKDKREGYEIISRYLPDVKLDCDDSSDFLYRINRPRITEILGHPLSINRLSTWKTLQLRRVSQTLVPGQQKTTVNAGTVTAIAFWATCELDINTAADNTNDFDNGQLSIIQDQLSTYALEILAKGDIP